MSHVINFELIVNFIMRIEGNGALFSKLMIFFVFVDLDLILSLDLLPVSE